MGDVAFPEESGWLIATPDSAMHLVILDVDGTTVIVRTRQGDATADLDTLYMQTLELLASATIG
jgi:hypothetical protein